jgi:hypothetical protein
MRSVVLTAVSIVLGCLPALAEAPDDLLTAPNAILCVSPDNLDIANHPAIGRSQVVLRGMGCLRTEAGIRARPLAGTEMDSGSPWMVRFYPAGISGGVVLWGLASSFTAPAAAADRSKLVPVKRAGP